MKRRLNLAMLGLWVAATTLPLPLGAAETTAHSVPAPPVSSGTDLESFRIIFDRNIFNPNRSGRSSPSDFTGREPERRVRTESFALVGTMAYEKGRFAFFDGSSPDYRKVLQASDGIAGYVIALVTPEHVTLQSTNDPDGEIKLPVGMQLQRQDAGKWVLGARLVEAASSVSSSASSNGSAITSPGPGGSEDEILRRMMQRREQEGGAAGAPPGPSASPTPAPASTGSNTSPASTGEDEIVRRMLEKREQELNR